MNTWIERSTQLEQLTEDEMEFLASRYEEEIRAYEERLSDEKNWNYDMEVLT